MNYNPEIDRLKKNIYNLAVEKQEFIVERKAAQERVNVLNYKINRSDLNGFSETKNLKILESLLEVNNEKH